MADEVKQKHPGGRPLKYKTPQELEARIQEYFKKCELTGKIINLVGLANFLGIHRETLNEYEKKDEFSDVIKKARQRCELDLVERMSDKNTFTPGLIFIAKNHYGYVDKQELTTPPGQPIEINSGLKGASEAELQEILQFVRQQTGEKR